MKIPLYWKISALVSLVALSAMIVGALVAIFATGQEARGWERFAMVSGILGVFAPTVATIIEVLIGD